MRIFSETSACAPAPTDTMQTTAATPTTIPSTVKALRSLFTRKRPHGDSQAFQGTHRYVLKTDAIRKQILVRRGVILDDPSVMQGDLSLRAIGDFSGMRDDNDGAAIAMKVFEQGQDLFAGDAVQCAGRFVGQNESGIVHDRARNDDPLLLASGELIWPMMTAVGQADAVERVSGSRDVV